MKTLDVWDEKLLLRQDCKKQEKDGKRAHHHDLCMVFKVKTPEKEEIFLNVLLLFQITLFYYKWCTVCIKLCKFCSAWKRLSTRSGNMLIKWYQWCLMGMQEHCIRWSKDYLLRTVLTTSGWCCIINEKKLIKSSKKWEGLVNLSDYLFECVVKKFPISMPDEIQSKFNSVVHTG